MQLSDTQTKLMWASLTIAVTAVASIPLALTLSSATPIPATANNSEPGASSSPSASPSAGKSTFYLAMQKDRCYAYSPDGTGSFSLKWAASDDSDARNPVSISCDGPHHLQVIAAPKLKVSGQDAPDLSKDATQACVDEYRKKFDKVPPDASSNWAKIDQKEQPPLLVLFPTRGPESKRYPGQVVCVTYRTSDDGAKILSID